MAVGVTTSRMEVPSSGPQNDKSDRHIERRRAEGRQADWRLELPKLGQFSPSSSGRSPKWLGRDPSVRVRSSKSAATIPLFPGPAREAVPWIEEERLRHTVSDPIRRGGDRASRSADFSEGLKKGSGPFSQNLSLLFSLSLSHTQSLSLSLSAVWQIGSPE